MSIKPKVSICIPTYKQPQYLHRALESIFCQTFNDYEIIITDDSPDDSIEKVVREFMDSSNMRYYRNKVRKGSPENWNEAIDLASGEYIKLLHHDDWFADKNSLTEFVDMLEQNPKANLAFCSSLGYCSYLENNVLEQKLRFIHIPTDSQIHQLRANPNILFAGNFIGAPSAIIYRNKVDFQFDPQLKWYVDTDFYIRMLSMNNSFAFSKKHLICITSEAVDHPTVTSQCVGNKSVEVFELLYLYRKISVKYPRNCQYLKVVWKLFDKYDISSVQDVKSCGVDFPIPQDVARILIFRKIFSNNVLILPKVYQRVYILFSSTWRKIIISVNGLIRKMF